MFRIKTLTWSVVCALSATGCATFSQPANAPQWRIEPSVGVRGSSPAAAYQAGRYHHAQLSYERAVAAYREALQMDPSHVDARNGLAIVFSAVGRHDEAVRELQAAIALAPHLGYLHNNLGYLYMLRGALPEAVKAFEEAKRLDPKNKKALENLRMAHARLTEATASAAAKTQTAPPLANTGANVQSKDEPQAGSRIVPVTPQIYEIRPAVAPEGKPLPPGSPPSPAAQVSAVAVEPAAAAKTQPAAEPMRAAEQAAALKQAGPSVEPAASKARAAAEPVRGAEQAAALRRFGLEVSNGMGLNGFAKRIAGRLAAFGFSTVRLTNQKPFEQPATEVQYRQGYAAEAADLASRIKVNVNVVRSDRLAGHIDVRLVLGRDAWTETALLQPAAPAQPVRLTAATLPARP